MAFDEPWKRGVIEAIHSTNDIPMDARSEYRLYRAVLERALGDYVKYRDDGVKLASATRESREDFHAAKDWIFDDYEPQLEGTVMSFPNVCLVLSVSPPAFRKLAREMTREELHRWSRAKAAVNKSESSQ